MPASPAPVQPKSNLLWWILGIVGAGILVVVVGSVFLGLYIARQIHLKQSADRVEIETPVGKIKVNKDDTHSTGLPVYPGATRERTNAASVEISSAGQKLGLAVEKYTSTDPLDAVQGWYAHRLGPDYLLDTKGSNGNWKKYVHVGTTEDVNVNDADVAFVNDRGKFTRLVALKRQSNATEITLLQLGEQEPQ